MSAPWRLDFSARRRALATVGVTVATMVIGASPLVPGGTPAASAFDPRLAEMASPSPFRGMVYTGLSLGRRGSACDGVFEAKSRTGASLGCSHGPDPAPHGTDVRRGRADHQLQADFAAGVATAAAAAADGEPGSAEALLGGIGCITDGLSGARVQAIYAVAADRADRSATVVPTIRSTYAPRVDRQLNQSAAETGGEAHVRFLTEPGGTGGCELSVSVAHLTAGGDDSFSNTVSELKAMGYNRPDRKYLVWADANVLCGVGSVYSDSRPGLNNVNNGYAPMFARVDAACWNYAEGHELMHTLGSVQRGAPHATANGHCWDESDDMCYDDDGNGPATMQTLCPGRDGSLFDCNHDDYFFAGVPPVSNWLATHWNTFNSSWILNGPLPLVALPPINLGGGTSTGTTTISPAPTTTTTTTTRPPSPDKEKPPKGRRSSGYWMLTTDGHVEPFGSAAFLGQPYPLRTGARAVDLEPTPSGDGYWVLDDAGQVRHYGDAVPFGSVPVDRMEGSDRAISLSATPTGEGYWVFTTRGRVLPFGDAGFFGDVSAISLNRPVTGSVATSSGLGYYLFASDGGIFTFGDAAFFGSTGAMRLNRPVVAMAVSSDRSGYWLVGSDGGLFAFGRAGFYGSMGAVKLNRPVSAVVPGEAGYLMVGEDGGAFSFGDVDFFGSLGAAPPDAPVVSVALRS
jgi:hypothetical protein